MAPMVDLSSSNLAIAGTVLVAGFLGSAHCAGMCGPLVLAVSKGRKQIWIYQTARLTSYLLVGALLGFLGQTLTKVVPSEYIYVPFLLFAFVLIWFGFLQAFRGPLHLSVPVLSAALRKLQTFAFKKSVSETSKHWALPALLGSFSVFLPCSHLYVFFAAATSTGSAFRGGIVMGAFALGTMPALSFGLTLIQTILSPLARRRVSGALLIVAGLLSLASFWYSQSDAGALENIDHQHEAPRCH